MPRKSLIVLVVLIGSAGLFSGVGADDHTEAHGGDLYDMPTGSAGEKFVITRSEDIDRSLLEFLKDDPIKGEDGLNSFDRMTRSYRISAELRSATHGTCILASFVHAESLKDLTKGVEVLDAVKDSGSFVVALGIGHGVQIWRIGVLEAVLHPHAYLGNWSSNAVGSPATRDQVRAFLRKTKRGAMSVGTLDRFDKWTLFEETERGSSDYRQVEYPRRQ